MSAIESMNVTFRFRLRKTELDALRLCADKHGVSPATFVRGALRRALGLPAPNFHQPTGATQLEEVS